MRRESDRINDQLRNQRPSASFPSYPMRPSLTQSNGGNTSGSGHNCWPTANRHTNPTNTMVPQGPRNPRSAGRNPAVSNFYQSSQRQPSLHKAGSMVNSARSTPSHANINGEAELAKGHHAKTMNVKSRSSSPSQSAGTPPYTPQIFGQAAMIQQDPVALVVGEGDNASYLFAPDIDGAPPTIRIPHWTSSSSLIKRTNCPDQSRSTPRKTESMALPASNINGEAQFAVYHSSQIMSVKPLGMPSSQVESTGVRVMAAVDNSEVVTLPDAIPPVVGGGDIDSHLFEMTEAVPTIRLPRPTSTSRLVELIYQTLDNDHGSMTPVAAAQPSVCLFRFSTGY